MTKWLMGLTVAVAILALRSVVMQICFRKRMASERDLVRVVNLNTDMGKRAKAYTDKRNEEMRQRLDDGLLAAERRQFSEHAITLSQAKEYSDDQQAEFWKMVRQMVYEQHNHDSPNGTHLAQPKFNKKAD